MTAVEIFFFLSGYENIGWWLFGCWFCDGAKMAEEERVLEWGLSISVGIGVCSDTKLM